YDDGKCKTLIYLHGTIQITYRATPYNIPVNFWIPTEYPKAPPLAFVAPTPNMIIKRSNYVDVSGRCYHPYLQNWGTQQNEESNLVTLCTILQNVFGQNSPVFTRTPSQSPTPPYSLQPPTNGGQNTLTSPVLHPRSLNPITPPPLPPPPPYQQNVSRKENRPRSHSGT
ncbi:7448_t:CDS:2, partial [Acaulospora morrowiae]